MYTVRGRHVTLAATANHVAFQVWNDHSTQRIKLVQFSYTTEAGGAAGDGFRFRRSSARGTAGSTVTAGIEHHSERAVAPPASLHLDLAAFSVQPTLVTGDIAPGWVRTASSAGASGGVFRLPSGIVIPPSTGLCWCQTKATAGAAAQVCIVVKEDY